MPTIADRLKNVSISASAAMTQRARDLAAEGIKVISLSAGEPDFATPSHAIEAAHAAALAGDTKYPPMDGTPALKAAISAQVQARQQSGLRCQPDRRLRRRQAGHLQCDARDLQSRRRGGDPGTVLDQLCRYRQIRRRRARAGPLPAASRLQAAARGSGSRDHAADEVAVPESSRTIRPVPPARGRR